MKKALIITRTDWSEPPRIRHQVTRLLRDNGYSITYIEKNSYKKFLIDNRKEEGIQFFGFSELLHHQLRYFPWIQEFNNQVVRFYLKRILKKVDFDFVINFCYEYHFLKELIPNRKIVTMIEDDFESQAKFGMQDAIRSQVRKTCEKSDVVLTVSYPLMEKLRTYNSDTRMLFPWSQQRYTRPLQGLHRNTVLYFGFIHRMNWPLVSQLVKETAFKFRFIGPMAKSIDKRMIAALSNECQNFEYIPYSTVTRLKLDDVFCSILPYDPRIKSVQACTISNRAFNLLSLGLPLVYADLHALIDAPQSVIRKNRNVEEYKSSLNFFHRSFYEIQDDIEAFLIKHYSEDRLSILEKAIND